MSDLISREALIDSLYSCEELKGRKTIEAVAKTIMEQPTVEAIPVVHGEWIDIREFSKDVPKCKCSICGYIHIGLESDSNFCPNCGAGMRKKVWYGITK